MKAATGKRNRGRDPTRLQQTLGQRKETATRPAQHTWKGAQAKEAQGERAAGDEDGVSRRPQHVQHRLGHVPASLELFGEPCQEKEAVVCGLTRRGEGGARGEP